MERFVNKIAVVTGSSAGIGRAISLKLIEKGIIVVGLARREEKLKEIANLVSNNKNLYKGMFHYIKCDVTSLSEIKNALSWIETNLGIPAILVCNAGVLKLIPVWNVTETDYDETFDTNVKSLFMSTLEVSRMMINGRVPGHIIMINSIAGEKIFEGDSRNIIYSASKFSVTAIGKLFKSELAQYGIKVSLINPGVVSTDMIPFAHKLNQNTILEPDDVADACISVLDTHTNCSMHVTIEAIEPFSVKFASNV